MKVELIYITPNALELIGECASECYASSTEPDANRRRAIACLDKGHLATLRFAHAIFRVSGISRTCSHQFVRSKHLDFLQASQRYIKEKEPEFITPPAFENDPEYLSFMNHCWYTYSKMVEKGAKKEDARFVLPGAAETSLRVVGNFQAWKDFINLRDIPEAQWEIRRVAQECKLQLHNHVPELF